MALANETFSNFAILICLVTALCVSYSGHFVKLLKLVHKLLFGPDFVIVLKSQDERVDVHLSLARIERVYH